MEPVRIFGIAPYPGLERIMQQVAAGRPDIQLTTVGGSLRNWQQALASVPASSYDVIVSRGGTARMLARSVRVPVVEITTSVYDMLCSLCNAQDYTGKLAVVGRPNIAERARQLAEVMQYDVTVCSIDSDADLKRELLRLKGEGCNLILGDSSAQHSAEELGLNSMLITSSLRSVQDAFDEAVRIVRLQSNLMGQNELFRQIIQSEWDELVVFRTGGEVVYSTRPEDRETEPFYDMLRSHLPAPDELPMETECEWDGAFWRISGQLVHMRQEPAVALRLKKNSFSVYSPENGILLSNRSDFQTAGLEPAAVPVCVGAVRTVIEAYAASPFPVLLLGEDGTGKDYAAIQLYRSGPNRQNPLITLDCQAICKKRWKKLFESDDSPLLQVGLTFYFKNIHCLSVEQSEALFHFMENSCTYRRNRMLFSAQNSSDGGYSCAYLQGHFSTIVLRLPPLRERREDIPSLLALCINQLNVLLGKQVVGFTEDALRLMEEFPWEGNLAQLDRVVRTLVVEADGPYIDRESVARQLQAERPAAGEAAFRPGYYPINLQQSLADIEYDVVRLVLEEEHNNQSRAAKRLKMGRSTLWSLLKKREQA